MMPTTSWVPICGQIDIEKMAWSPAMRIPLSMPSRLKADLLGLGKPLKKDPSTCTIFRKGADWHFLDMTF